MSIRPVAFEPPTVSAHLLGSVDFAAALALQRRLVYEAGEQFEPRIVLLICEHRPLIALGRAGSRAHVRLSDDELRRRELALVWTNRGGGAWPHLPGQLAIYPLVPLALIGWSVGRFFGLLRQGLQNALAEFHVPTQTRPGSLGLWGRSGQLVAGGAAVKDWITYHGAFLNVAPEMSLFRRVVTDPLGRTSAGSLAQERQGHVAMPTVRSAVVRHLSAAFGCEKFHLHTGHPFLAGHPNPPESARRAS
ncbi:MAG TPA: hypothetical protein VFE24_14890 [Pirellulales bacterium]|jgi:lipoyl(octanoyl) transferase|nr:hypothetical protein [Pirellulales bacterium]